MMTLEEKIQGLLTVGSEVRITTDGYMGGLGYWVFVDPKDDGLPTLSGIGITVEAALDDIYLDEWEE